MMVPSSRLLFWVAAIVLPFATLAAVAPASLALCLVLIVGFLLVVVVDAAGAARNLTGIKVELPPLVRMSKDRAAAVQLQVRKQAAGARVVRVALDWPAEIKPTHDEMDVTLPAGSEGSRLGWDCTPLRRGKYHLTAAYLESPSSLGFWLHRQTMPIASELRVYPNLLTERKNLAAMFLNRGVFGVHAQRQVGKGRDFEKLREYVPGDGYDEIHWKVTARRGKPITKVFQIEKTQEVYVIVDASRLTARRPDSAGMGETSVLERFVTCALVLGMAAEKQGDLFGLLTFSNRVEKFIRAKNGQAHYNACRDALYTLQPSIVTPDFDELCTFIRLRLRRRALLIFLTALDDPGLAESFVRNMEMIRRQHLVLVNMVQTPGMKPLFTDASVTELDGLYEQLGGHLRWQNLRELQKVLQRRGVRFSLLDNERMSAELVSQYMNVKQRQLL